MSGTKKSSSFKKILVTGGTGTLGLYVPQFFPESNVLLLTKKDLDVSDKKSVSKKIQQFKPDLIFHLAAFTNVDECELHPDYAMKINVEGTRNIVNVCKEMDIPLVFISTATVFDGKRPPKGGYTENDSPSPINVYGKTKVMGEKIIQDELSLYLIVRIGWLLGGKENKFFVSYISKRIENGEEIKAVNDIFGTVAYAKNLMSFIKEKLYKKEYGLYHFASHGKCSRYDIAMVLRNLLNKKSTIIPVSFKNFLDDFPAQRPQIQVIKSAKVDYNKEWDTTLHEYIKDELLK